MGITYAYDELYVELLGYAQNVSLSTSFMVKSQVPYPKVFALTPSPLRYVHILREPFELVVATVSQIRKPAVLRHRISVRCCFLFSFIILWVTHV